MKATKRTRKPNEPLSNPVRERYAGQRAMGFSQRAAFKTASPSAKKMKQNVVDASANRLERDPDVQARIAEINTDMLKSSKAFLNKADLAEMISDELREAIKEPGALTAANGLVATYCKMFGFFEPEKAEIKVGCISEDAKNARIAKLLKLNRT